MESQKYADLQNKIEEIRDKLIECEKHIFLYSEKGDITQKLKISKTRIEIELWLELLKEFY